MDEEKLLSGLLKRIRQQPQSFRSRKEDIERGQRLKHGLFGSVNRSTRASASSRVPTNSRRASHPVRAKAKGFEVTGR